MGGGGQGASCPDGIGGQSEGAEMTGGRYKPEDGDVDIPVEGKTAGPSPELTSNPFRFLFWNWITALMKTGYRKPLEVSLLHPTGMFLGIPTDSLAYRAVDSK